MRNLVLFLCLMGLFGLLTVDSAEGHGNPAGILHKSLIAKWTDCAGGLSTTRVTRKYKTRQLCRTPSYGGVPGAPALPPSLHEHTREFFEREFVKRDNPDYDSNCDDYREECEETEYLDYLGFCYDDDSLNDYETSEECNQRYSSPFNKQVRTDDGYEYYLITTDTECEYTLIW